MPPLKTVFNHCRMTRKEDDIISNEGSHKNPIINTHTHTHVQRARKYLRILTVYVSFLGYDILEGLFILKKMSVF